MRTTKYFYNAEADRLVIVEVEDGEATNVLELSDPLTVTEEEDEEESEEEEPAPPAPKKVTEPKPRGGRTATYDKDEVKDAIRDGMKPAAVADKYNISVGTVYQLKSEMKKNGELDQDGPNEDEEEEAVHDDPFVARMIKYLREGRTDQEIYNFMHDAITDEQFRQKLEIAKRSK